MTKSIEQQLQEFSANPVVDGVRWEVVQYEGLIDGFKVDMGAGFGILIYPLYETGVENTFEHWEFKASGLFKASELSQKQFKASTPADACREALRICRERVAELAGALKMIPNEADINTAAEIYAEAENNCYTADLYGFQHGAKYVLNFNQPTGAKTYV